MTLLENAIEAWAVEMKRARLAHETAVVLIDHGAMSIAKTWQRCAARHYENAAIERSMIQTGMKMREDMKALDDNCYPMVWMSEETDATPEQKKALFQRWKMNDNGMSWVEFFHTASYAIGCDGALVVEWCGMWLCVEPDGHCHT